MARHENENWNLPDDVSWNVVQAALLMDIRDELQKLNAVFACPNFIGIPTRLTSIHVDTREVARRLRTISAKIPPRKKKARQ